MSHRYGRGDVMARDSRQIADLLAPVNGIRGEQQRRGEKPRDFMRENRRDLAERQKENRAVLRQEEELQAHRREEESRKCSKYQAVPSRVKGMMVPSPRSGGSPTPEEEEGGGEGFLRKHSRETREDLAAQQRKEEWEQKKREMVRHKDWLEKEERERKPAVPTVEELAAQPKTRAPTRDFVRKNAQEATSKPATPSGAAPRQRRKSDVSSSSSAPTHQAGEVPEYLIKRKAEMAEMEAERRRQEERAKIPAGMTILPEDQRVETVRGLHEQVEEINRQMNRLPIANDTLRVRRRREELQEQLEEVERAIKMFSQRVVYVMED